MIKKEYFFSNIPNSATFVLEIIVIVSLMA